MNNIVDEIKKLKEERNAVILAHYYVDGAIQDIADYLGDSYYLSKIAVDCPQDVIVFAGVEFMGESAKLLSPNKTVLMPDSEADCPMAHMVDEYFIARMREKYEDLCVVLGNMLDNAIEASEKVTDRWINVSIGLRKNGLVIVVENSFDGIIKKNIHGNIISIKENKEHHGYGLKSIRKTVEKYDGELVVEIRGNIFRAVAFMTCIDYV